MSVERLKQLHQKSEPFIIGNVWDAHSAQIAEKVGFEALGSSSHAIANMLGYEDGENITLDELVFVVERIVRAVNVPVSVDLESGYADDPEEVALAVKRLADIGVVGINLEDGKVEAGTRKLGDPDLLAAKIKAIKSRVNIFVNARTDTYTTKQADARDESIERGKQYAAAGADGLFVPLVEEESDIRAIVESTPLPLNVFVTPGLPSLDTLGTLGVKRISYGAKVYEKVVGTTEQIFADLLDKKAFDRIF